MLAIQDKIQEIETPLATPSQVRDVAKKIILTSPTDQPPSHDDVFRQRNLMPLCLIAAQVDTDKYKLYAEDATWAAGLLSLTAVKIGRYDCLFVNLKQIVHLATLLPKSNDIIILPGVSFG